MKSLTLSPDLPRLTYTIFVLLSDIFVALLHRGWMERAACKLRSQEE